MEKTYSIIRVSPETLTLTVMLNVDGRQLQQDVVVANLTDMDMIDREVKKHLKKFAEDLERNEGKKNRPVHPDLQKIIDDNLRSFK